MKLHSTGLKKNERFKIMMYQQQLQRALSAHVFNSLLFSNLLAEIYATK
jgi:hypothetical protein